MFIRFKQSPHLLTALHQHTCIRSLSQSSVVFSKTNATITVSPSSSTTTKSKGRRPRSVRDTAPDPFEQEKNLLSDQLARTQQSTAAKEASSSSTSEAKPRNRPRNRINTAKLHLLSGHEKIELFRQLLSGGSPHLHDAAVLYSLICKNGISDRLKYQDFHNLFRLLCAQKEADRYPLLVQRVWNDWGRNSNVGVYSVAAYAAYVKIIANWGDRVLARQIYADMQRDGVIGPDSITESNGGLRIDTFNQLLHLFTTPTLQLDTTHLIQAAQAIDSNPQTTSDETRVQPPYIQPNTSPTRTLSKPTFQDLEFAQKVLLPNIIPEKTTTTHIHILTLYSALQDLNGLVAAHEAALNHVDSVSTATGDLIASCHASLKLNTHGLACFLNAGFTEHAVAIVESLPKSVVVATESVFLESSGDGGVESGNVKGMDMLRKDAQKLLVLCLKTLSFSSRSGSAGDFDKMTAIAETLVKSLNGVIGCRLDEHCISYLVKLYGYSKDLSRSEEWAGRGSLWFDETGKSGIRVRTALTQVYAQNAARVDSLDMWEVLREKSLRMVEEIVEANEGKTVLFGRGFSGAVLDALDTLEIVAGEKGYVSKLAGMDEREKLVRALL
ncbi:UNVERIFIED_CONTAM: hypothetical protein HDU68_007695 [Siphonaria sp. JEL0065]|nr:hypothetical protein HDU68_007695 [Siphonaria sp. JEL0065]